MVLDSDALSATNVTPEFFSLALLYAFGGQYFIFSVDSFAFRCVYIKLLAGLWCDVCTPVWNSCAALDQAVLQCSCDLIHAARFAGVFLSVCARFTLLVELLLLMVYIAIATMIAFLSRVCSQSTVMVVVDCRVFTILQ